MLPDDEIVMSGSEISLWPALPLWPLPDTETWWEAALAYRQTCRDKRVETITDDFTQNTDKELNK